ncbi:hypothetical protein [Herpetosiphon gulosus]
MTILTDAARGVLLGYTTAYPQPLYLAWRAGLVVQLLHPALADATTLLQALIPRVMQRDGGGGSSAVVLAPQVVAEALRYLPQLHLVDLADVPAEAAALETVLVGRGTVVIALPVGVATTQLMRLVWPWLTTVLGRMLTPPYLVTWDDPAPLMITRATVQLAIHTRPTPPVIGAHATLVADGDGWLLTVVGERHPLRLRLDAPSLVTLPTTAAVRSRRR